MPALTATFMPVSRPTSGHDLLEVGHQPLVGAPHGVDQAELAGPQLGGLAGRPQHLVVRQQRHGLDRRVELRRLRAEVAVLGAAAGLGRQDALDLDRVAAPRDAHRVGGVGEGGDVVVGQRGQGGELVERELAPVVDERPASGVDQLGAVHFGRGRRHAGNASCPPAGGAFPPRASVAVATDLAGKSCGVRSGRRPGRRRGGRPGPRCSGRRRGRPTRGRSRPGGRRSRWRGRCAGRDRRACPRHRPGTCPG